MSDASATDTTYAVIEMRKGPDWSPGVSLGLVRLQIRHLRTLWRLRRAGLVLLAGPTPGEGDVRGLVICRPDDVPMVAAALERDAAVRAGRLSVGVVGGPGSEADPTPLSGT